MSMLTVTGPPTQPQSLTASRNLSETYFGINQVKETHKQGKGGNNTSLCRSPSDLGLEQRSVAVLAAVVRIVHEIPFKPKPGHTKAFGATPVALSIYFWARFLLLLRRSET